MATGSTLLSNPESCHDVKSRDVIFPDGLAKMRKPTFVIILCDSTSSTNFFFVTMSVLIFISFHLSSVSRD